MPSPYMKLALALAAKGRLSVSPNPMVGCVIVKDGQIIGQGYHERAGCAHAEVNALNQAGDHAQGADAYVNLEPCCHYGKTPPCINALIKAGIKRVYAACLDPNPLVAGQGVKALQAAGIEVRLGDGEKETKQLNEIFFHYIQNKKPFVIAKWAMSLDGKTITHHNDDRKISGQEAQVACHELRQQVDAVLIGSQTAKIDNPALTVRLSDQTNPKQPIRIILNSKANLPLNLKMFDTPMPAKTMIVISQTANPEWLQQAQAKQICILQAKSNPQGKIDIPNLLDILGQENITSLLVEGGMNIHQAFFAANAVNRIHVYLAPLVIADLENKQSLIPFHIQNLGNDYHITTTCEENHYV